MICGAADAPYPREPPTPIIPLGPTSPLLPLCRIVAHIAAFYDTRTRRGRGGREFTSTLCVYVRACTVNTALAPSSARCLKGRQER